METRDFKGDYHVFCDDRRETSYDNEAAFLKRVRNLGKQGYHVTSIAGVGTRHVSIHVSKDRYTIRTPGYQETTYIDEEYVELNWRGWTVLCHI